MRTDDEILDDEALAARWKVEGTPDAIKKKFYRLRQLDANHPRHLKWFPVGGSPRYRLSDIIDYENRNTRHFLASLSNLPDDLADWIDAARLAGLDKDD